MTEFVDDEDQDYTDTKDFRNINECRKLVGLKPLSYEKVPCKRCKKPFLAQFVGKNRQIIFCLKCNYQVNREVGLDFRGP